MRAEEQSIRLSPRAEPVPATDRTVSVSHEWGVLKEAIVGIQPADRFVLPRHHRGWNWMPERFARLCRLHAGRLLHEVDEALADEVQRQIDALAETLKSAKVRVRRLYYPESRDNLTGPGTGEGILTFARDSVLIVGNSIIELTVTEAWRFRERFAVRPVLVELARNRDVMWISMPQSAPNMPRGAPRLEGGDVLLNGNEVYVGCSGFYSTLAGVEWLQKYLGRGYTVYPIALPVEWMHLDAALCLLADGLALRAPHAFKAPLPGRLSKFEFIDLDVAETRALATQLLPIDDSTLLMDTRGLESVAHRLETYGFVIQHIDYDAVQAYGSGLRSSVHPVRRITV